LKSGSARRVVRIIFFLNQNDIVSEKKNKNQRVTAEFLTGFCQVNQVKILPKLWVEKLHAGC
jgi:hypothetical protein